MAPFEADAIVGSRLTLSTPATQRIGPTTYAFTGWSDGGARVHDVVVPAAHVTYRASFTRISPTITARSPAKWATGWRSART